MPKYTEKRASAHYIRYTPLSQQGQSPNLDTKDNFIRIVKAKLDPMEPPKFKFNKNIPPAPQSPPSPAPVRPTPRIKIEQEQKKLSIPLFIRKNAKILVFKMRRMSI